MNDDPWISTDADCIIERVELRVKGRKPLVMVSPSFPILFKNTKQYLGTSHNATIEFLRVSVLDSRELPTVDELTDIHKILNYLLNT